MLNVCELYKSIQGESTHAGRVCAFVRLSGCNLSCSYCDTRYAFEDGAPRQVEDIVDEVGALGCDLVEISGGEPLLQDETPALCAALVAAGRTVLVETNGSIDIAKLPDGCIRIVDIKCPASGMEGSFRIENIAALCERDECKTVLCDKSDFDWALSFVRKHNIHKRCTVLFTPASGRLNPADLAAWIIDSHAPVRMGLQMHKVIWGEDARGV
ncbi:MAG: radical SAM protein [Chitinivibrionales bacterium]|nr:radical SAM protein [Chitinivibrionales bacterium]MBD3395576.1 radical SAM protein [Chitinivibrionales bacterium]